MLTYTSVDVIDAKRYKVLTSAPIPHQPQAEWCIMCLACKSLLRCIDVKKVSVYVVPVVSDGTPTPTPSDYPGSETDVPEDQAGGIQNQKGTLLALGLAGFVALVAGTVVGLVRKP